MIYMSAAAAYPGIEFCGMTTMIKEVGGFAGLSEDDGCGGAVMRYASSAVAFNSRFYRLPPLTCPIGVARLPQGRKWRRLYRGILVAYRTAVAGGAGFEDALAAAVDAAQNRLFIPSMLAGDVLRQLPFPYDLEPVYMRLSPPDIARGVWRYWDEHPYGDGSVPLFDMGILVEPYWQGE